MTFEKATAQDTGILTELRIAYLQEDLGEIEAADLKLIESLLPGRRGIVLNVYTKPEYRKKGYAKKIMNMMLEDAKAENVSIIELKATEDGYSLYRSVGFEDVVAKYHNMRISL